MTDEKLKRINELAHLSKERALTEEEKTEQARLRKEYIAEWKRGAEQVLESIYLVDEKGTQWKLPKKNK